MLLPAALLPAALALLLGPVAPPPGPWVAPVAGPPVVVRGFDPPADPWGAGHRGVDLQATPGESVLAAGAGRVTFAAVLAGRGVVVVTHGDLRTTYEPVDAAVTVGSTVVAGAVLGRLAARGGHCPPETCLHWGLLRGSDYLDPMQLLRGRGVRLLPLAGRVPLVGDPGMGVSALAPGSSPAIGSPTAAGRPPTVERVTGQPPRGPAHGSPPLLTTAGAVTTGVAGAAAVWWRRRGPP